MDNLSNKNSSEHSKIIDSGLSLPQIIDKLATQLLEEKKNNIQIHVEYNELLRTHKKALEESKKLTSKIEALLNEDISRLSQELLLKEVNNILNNKSND